MLNDLKGPINNCDISRIDNEMTWKEKMLLTNFDCTKSKNHNNNCNNNHNGDKVSNKK